MKTLYFTTSINCGGCIASVKPYLDSVSNINKWNVDTENPQKILTVHGIDIQENEVMSQVEKAGFSIKPMEK